MFQNKKRTIFLITGAIVTLSLLIGILLFLKNKQDFSNQAKLKSEVNSIWKDSIKDSNLDRSNPQAVVAQLEKVLEDNENKLDLESEVSAKLVLADNYYAVDPKKGIGILKEIIANDKYKNASRAKAVLILSDNYDYFHRDPFYIGEVFTGDFFSKFIKKDDVPLAFANLNQFADQLYPNVIAEYRASRYWSTKALSDSSEQKNDDLKRSNEFLAKANSNFDLADKNNWWSDMSQKGLAYKLKGEILENLYFSNLSEGSNSLQYSIDDIHDSYKKSISVLESPSSNRYMKFFSYYARFYYASFLSKLDSAKYADEIKKVLDPIKDPNTDRRFLIYKFLANERGNDGSPEQQAINRLKVVDSDFGKLVDSLQNQ